MSPDQVDRERAARRGQVGHERAHVVGGRAPREQDGGQEPAWCRAADRDVVGIDRHDVAADLISGERDGIGRRHEQAVTQVDDRGVLAHARPHAHAPVPRRQRGQHGGEQIGR